MDKSRPGTGAYYRPLWGRPTIALQHDQNKANDYGAWTVARKSYVCGMIVSYDR